MNDDLTRESFDALHAQGSLQDVDYFMAGAIGRRYGIEDLRVLLAAAMASRVVAGGYVCLELEPIAGKCWPDMRDDSNDDVVEEKTTVTLPPVNEWIKALQASAACGSADETDRPLILVQDTTSRVYLRRYYQYEQEVARQLRSLAQAASLAPVSRTHGCSLEELFPADASNAQERPRLAAQVALGRRLLILSGGPGTGKTYTLARLLVMLAAAGIEQDRKPVIRMAAPTGKAAMRMRESIRAAKKALKLASDVAQDIPEDACTLHRLLGTRPDSLHFRHNKENPLPADIVIVDEASMIDLPLMAKLLDALNPDTRLILLGDMHQLSSVAPGYVLGDICTAALFGPAAPLSGSLVELTHSWRFSADGPVGRLGTALRIAGEAGDPDGAQAWQTLQKLQGDVSPNGDEVVWHDTPETLEDAEKHPLKDLRHLILEKYRPFVEADRVESAFKALGDFRILCALRRGPQGVETLNKLTEDILAQKHATFKADDPRQPARKLAPAGRFYDHRVIMVTRNDYGLRLFNGDVGIILPETANGDAVTAGTKPRLVAWFEEADEETGATKYRALPCHMLPEHETAFAMTIHKSQGSQFRDVLVMLPYRENPGLTKELLYTGITRAEKRVSLWCSEAVFKQASTSRTQRASGLTTALSVLSVVG